MTLIEIATNQNPIFERIENSCELLEESPTIFLRIGWENTVKRITTRRTPLESPFFEDGHRQASNGRDSPTNHFSFQRVQPRFVPIGQFNEWNSLCNVDDVGQCEWTESLETECRDRGRRTDVPPTLSAGIRQ